MVLIVSITFVLLVISMAVALFFEGRERKKEIKNEKIKPIVEKKAAAPKKTTKVVYTKVFEPARLFYACECKDWDIVKKMFHDFDVDVNIKNYDGNTILFFACRSEDLEFIKYLVDDLKADIHLLNKFGENVLFAASECKSPDILKYFIEEKNMDINIINVFNESILFNACRKASIDTIKYLIKEKNMDFSVVNKYGKSLYDVSSYDNAKYISSILNTGNM